MRFISTRSPRQRATFLEALGRGVPPDGGCYVPEPVPCFRDVGHVLDQPFQERSVEILVRMMGDEFSRETLEAVVAAAFDFPMPLKSLSPRLHVLELFHGPSLSFKDVGARFLASFLRHDLISSPPTPQLRWAVGSGNMAAATACAFAPLADHPLALLIPKGSLSPVDARLMAADESWRLVLEVDGSLDACLALERACLADRSWVDRVNLCVVDSLHPAFIFGMLLCHFEAVAQLRLQAFREAPVIGLACGTFSTLYAGLLAREMGLPVRAFVAAVHGNRAALAHLEGAAYVPQTVEASLTPALDVGDPAHWASIRHLLGDALDRLREGLRWGAVEEGALRKLLWELHALNGAADPHLAVAYGVLQANLGLREGAVLWASAHPSKTPVSLQKQMNLDLSLPESLAACGERPVRTESVACDAAAVKARLERFVREAT